MAIGGAVPIISTFKEIGEGISNTVAPKDANGVKQGNDFQVGLSSLFDPMQQTKNAFKDITSGKFNGRTALNLVAPFIGGVLDNKDARRKIENAEELAATQRIQYQDNNVSYNPVYGHGGKLPLYPDGGGLPIAPVSSDKRPYKDTTTPHSYKDPFSGKPFWVVQRSEVNKDNPDIFPIDYNEAGSNIVYGTYKAPKEGDTDYLNTTFRNYTDDNTTKVLTPSQKLQDIYFGRNPYTDRKQLANPALLQNPNKNAYFNNDALMAQDSDLKAKGGFIDYANRGDKHGTGNDIPVDSMGNYSQTPAAKVEEGETTYQSPQESPYVMSDQIIHSKSKSGKPITFADQSRRIHNKYKMRLENDKITQDAYHLDMQNLMQAQEDIRNSIDSTIKAKGGPIEPNGPEDYMTLNPLQAKSGIIPNQIDRPQAALNNNIVDTSTSSGIGESPYQGSVSPLGVVASVAGNLGMMARNRRNKPKDLNFKDVNPELINLEPARTSIKEQANSSRANTFNALRRVGANQGQYMANAVSATNDIDRTTNEALKSSYLNEQLANSQAKQSASSQNAQMNAQQQMYNQQNLQDYNAQQNAYLASAISAVPQYFKDLQSAKNSAIIANMANPNVQLVEDPTQNRFDKIVRGAKPRLKFKG